MSGDWIKMRIALADDPAVIGIADATGIDEFGVIGRLHRLWGWVDEQSSDGRVGVVTCRWINRFVQCDGFAEAMVSVGWLSIEEGGISFPNFDRHNGKSAKKRALSTLNKQIERSRKGRHSVADASSAHDDKSTTREEKRVNTNSTSSVVAARVRGRVRVGDDDEDCQRGFTPNGHAGHGNGLGAPPSDSGQADEADTDGADESDVLLTAGDAVSLRLIARERERGKFPRGVSAGNAQVLELVRAGVTTSELRRAYDLAVADREATGDPAPVNAGFVLSLLPRVRHPQPPRSPPLQAMSDVQLNAEGRRVGCGEARAGESRAEFVARILAARGQLRSTA